MENQETSFFLVCLEPPIDSEIFKCTKEERLNTEGRDDFLVVSISPPIDGKSFGINEKIHRVVLATRHAGTSLHPPTEWPLHVYVCNILNKEIIANGTASADDLQVLSIGPIFKTREEAATTISRDP